MSLPTSEATHAQVFLLPLLKNHDRGTFHVTSFSAVHSPDQITQDFRSCSDDWVDVAHMPDDDFIASVRARSVDILIDCNGHTSGSRLSAFARRCAPVQASWLGYPHTSGLRNMVYRLTDDVASPSQMNRYFSEEFLIVSGGFHTFESLAEMPEPSVARLNSKESIRFGVFNRLAKISDSCLTLWNRILEAEPGSQLLVKTIALSDPIVESDFRTRCEQAGIETSRLILKGLDALFVDHYRAFNEIDIALDTFPYNGTTTTCEALKMGIPVVTLLGDKPASRVGASLLTQIGRQEWIAESDEEYVRMASLLASDNEGLKRFRTSLKLDIANSTLGDVRKFATSMEAAYRTVWRRWCNDVLTK